MGDKDEPVSVEEMLRQAFRQYEEPNSMVSAADQIVCAVAQGPRLYFTQDPSGKLTVSVGDGEAFEVELPFGMFRMLLARFSGICGAAAEKRSSIGKAKSSLMRAGILIDKHVTEQKDQTIEYVSAIIREGPSSPVYKVDADLDVKQPNGTAATLHLQMNNRSGQYFLLIEPRKSTQ